MSPILAADCTGAAVVVAASQQQKCCVFAAAMHVHLAVAQAAASPMGGAVSAGVSWSEHGWSWCPLISTRIRTVAEVRV